MIFVYILAVLLGACIGSFLNVLIYRVPNGISIIKPNSHCPKCKTMLTWQDNIPVLSWLFLGGRCRHCKAPISPIYILVELLNVLLWLLCAFVFWKTNPYMAIIFALALSMLMCVMFVDLKHKWIPDSFQLVLLILGVLATVFDTFLPWTHHLLGAFVGGGIMLLFYGFGWLVYKKEALGFGDVKLMAVTGLILGWRAVIVALVLGAVIGAISCLIIRLVTKSENQEYPFAPYLVLGAVISMFFGNDLMGLYLSLF